MSDSATQLPPLSYEQALHKLEEVVTILESRDRPLSELLALYETALFSLQHCRSQLETVEHQIKVLDEGALKPWTPT